MEGEKGTVCVTGGTGFIASHLIMKLLHCGYNVRATVRPDPECERDLSYLKDLPGAKENLKIYNADLNEPDSFNDAITGCVGVFHLAAPMDIQDSEPEEIVSKRAMEGTLGILKACLNSKTVKRVVYTSSEVAVIFNDKDVNVMDESSWTDTDFYKASKGLGTSYVCSKTKTEKMALEFAEEHGLDLLSVIPCMTVGRFMCPRLPVSVFMALAMIMGKEDQYKYLLMTHMVHIDDLVSAHIFLFENPKAKGRYICSSNEMTIYQMSEFLSAKYPEYQIPDTDFLKKIEGYKVPRVTSKKLLDSGFKFKYSLDEMYDDAIECCKERGFL